MPPHRVGCKVVGKIAAGATFGASRLQPHRCGCSHLPLATSHDRTSMVNITMPSSDPVSGRVRRDSRRLLNLHNVAVWRMALRLHTVVYKRSGLVRRYQDGAKLWQANQLQGARPPYMPSRVKYRCGMGATTSTFCTCPDCMYVKSTGLAFM
ncbi:hypothetical protein BC832DRAFT_552705 [Gaertneriomyces semiglobifer]|nr:hypothetical protein BC832DRAFT_552705 [Gaertneriomyces semiglobifer]